MRRTLLLGGAGALLLALTGCGGVSLSGDDGGSLTVAGIETAPRSGDYAGYTVRYTNSTDQVVSNPQFHTVIRVGGQNFLCYGYQDAATQAAVLRDDAESHPLTIPAKQELQATIYCKIPADYPVDGAQVLQRP